jgi:hypothetical protein
MHTQWIDFIAERIDPGMNKNPTRIFGLAIRGKTYPKIKARAEKIARRLAYGMHFYEVTYKPAPGQYETDPETLQTWETIPNPYQHGGKGYTRPDDGMDD